MTPQEKDERPGEPISATQDAQLERWGRDMAEDDYRCPIWVERTWTDVRAGDTVRMPGMPETEALITGRLYHPSEDSRGEHWHVVHDGTTGKWAHTNDVVVQPGECVIVSAGIQGAERGRWMNPAAPVDIQVPGPDPYATIEAIELAGGWPNRMGFMATAPNASCPQDEGTGECQHTAANQRCPVTGDSRAVPGA